MITNDEALSILRKACAEEKTPSDWARKYDFDPKEVLRVLRGDISPQIRFMSALGYKPVNAWVKV